MNTKGCTCPIGTGQWSGPVCARCGHQVLESQLTPLILRTLCSNTGLILWRNPRGYDRRTRNTYGLTDGAADYIGLYAPTGKFVGVELKTPVGRQSTAQKEFAALVTSGNAIYDINRSEADARALLERLKRNG